MSWPPQLVTALNSDEFKRRLLFALTGGAAGGPRDWSNITLSSLNTPVEIRLRVNEEPVSYGASSSATGSRSTIRPAPASQGGPRASSIQSTNTSSNNHRAATSSSYVRSSANDNYDVTSRSSVRSSTRSSRSVANDNYNGSYATTGRTSEATQARPESRPVRSSTVSGTGSRPKTAPRSFNGGGGGSSISGRSGASGGPRGGGNGDGSGSDGDDEDGGTLTMRRSQSMRERRTKRDIASSRYSDTIDTLPSTQFKKGSISIERAFSLVIKPGSIPIKTVNLGKGSSTKARVGEIREEVWVMLMKNPVGIAFVQEMSAPKDETWKLLMKDYLYLDTGNHAGIMIHKDLAARTNQIRPTNILQAWQKTGPNEIYASRMCATLLNTKSGEELLLISWHGPHKVKAKGRIFTQLQRCALHLRHDLGKSQVPIIIGGDFNIKLPTSDTNGDPGMSQGDDDVAILDRHFRNASVNGGGDAKIDGILYTRDVAVNDLEATKHSGKMDHDPLIGKLSLEPKKSNEEKTDYEHLAGKSSLKPKQSNEMKPPPRSNAVKSSPKPVDEDDSSCTLL